MRTFILLGVFLETIGSLQAKTAPDARIDSELADRTPADGAQTGSWEKRRSFLHGRIFHSAVWAYPEMIVWGGGSDHQFFNDGGLYNPVLDTWREVATTHGLSARWAHAAVWTGREMIIWGGRGSFAASDHKNDGALYNPYTNTWRPMSLENAPEGRSQMAAVWTGVEMIVWGGTGDDGRCFNNGARYNPKTDSWTPLPLEQAPEARCESAFVWTGDELVVWGGLLEGGSQSCGTGGRYSPQTDSWRPLPVDGAPASARGLNAVWTGSEVLVWGGAHLDDGDALNIGRQTGACYNPDTHSWQATALEKAPEGRLYHAAVWTGSEMLVWGGGDQREGHFTTGGRYHPDRRQWTSTASTGAPSGRGMATAIWTGEGMLIYGGSTGGESAFNETYYYRPTRQAPSPQPDGN
ncbi:MAG: hypothetical protein ACKV19_29285 [Verrucomicrobiales bacterium]